VDLTTLDTAEVGISDGLAALVAVAVVVAAEAAGGADPGADAVVAANY